MNGFSIIIILFAFLLIFVLKGVAGGGSGLSLKDVSIEYRIFCFMLISCGSIGLESDMKIFPIMLFLYCIASS